MANEILYAGLADSTLAEVLSSEFILLSADRNALPMHPALFYVGDCKGRGSNVIKVPHIGLAGYDKLAQVADGAEVANTALTDGSSTVTVARYSKAYEVTDMAKFQGANGLLKGPAFAQDAVFSSARTLMDLIADIIDGFTATAGTAGAQMTFDDFHDAVTMLEAAEVEGPYMTELHPVQYGHFRGDLANTQGGALQWLPSTQEQLKVRPKQAAKGSFMEVDIFVSGEIKTANAGVDRAGGMWGRGAVLHGDMSLDQENDPNQLLIGGKILLERVRTARKGQTGWVTHRYLGASMGLDDRGVSIITKAS